MNDFAFWIYVASLIIVGLPFVACILFVIITFTFDVYLTLFDRDD